MPAGEQRDLPVTVDLQAKTFNKWSLAGLFTLRQLWVWCPSICSGWLPLPYGSRICQGVVRSSGWGGHLLPITPWQSAGRRPRCCSVNYYSRFSRARGKRRQSFGSWSLDLDLTFTVTEVELSHSSQRSHGASLGNLHFSITLWISLLSLATLSD